ncbi:hypothetical protein B0T10DRAFT_256854 [Thelonectria olida]|uniref:Uncharacterized protein n=1 Tax=Thelonectria olida TaxID=1576542 RepID=A0A9P8WB34_9HYPO|nr:hypothetical protein B0T10DRAFT_256854 [Thelonectria olida]
MSSLPRLRHHGLVSSYCIGALVIMPDDPHASIYSTTHQNGSHAARLPASTRPLCRAALRSMSLLTCSLYPLSLGFAPVASVSSSSSSPTLHSSSTALSFIKTHPILVLHVRPGFAPCIPLVHVHIVHGTAACHAGVGTTPAARGVIRTPLSPSAPHATPPAPAHRCG